MTTALGAAVLSATERADAYARNLRVLTRQLDGLTHADTLARPPVRGNCLNWVLGHIAVHRDYALASAGEDATLDATAAARYGNGAAPVLGDGHVVVPLETLSAALDLARARHHADRARDHATEPRQPLALLAAHRLLGELDTTAGRHADAARHLDAALALAEACAAPYERALTLLPLAELRIAARAHDAARAALAEARAVLTRLGARPALARCDALATRLPGQATDSTGGPTPPPVAAPHPARLTAREVELLRLIAGGLSNREMAEALCRSERTVQRHVANAYLKIGAHNKAEATAFALRHHLA